MDQNDTECFHDPKHIFYRISVPINKDRVGPSLRNRSKWVHETVECAGCQVTPVVGVRYVCTQCGKSICEFCEQQGFNCHGKEQSMIKMGRPVGIALPRHQPESAVHINTSVLRPPIGPSDGEAGSVGMAMSASSIPPQQLDMDRSVVTLESLGVSFSDLLAMLRRENELRLSDQVQAQYKEKGYDGYVEVTVALQAQVAAEFGHSTEVGAMLLQCAEALVPPEEGDRGLEAVKDASLYRKFNRFGDSIII